MGEDRKPFRYKPISIWGEDMHDFVGNGGEPGTRRPRSEQHGPPVTAPAGDERHGRSPAILNINGESTGIGGTPPIAHPVDSRAQCLFKIIFVSAGHVLADIEIDGSLHFSSAASAASGSK